MASVLMKYIKAGRVLAINLLDVAQAVFDDSGTCSCLSLSLFEGWQRRENGVKDRLVAKGVGSWIITRYMRCYRCCIYGPPPWRTVYGLQLG
jgi:hypothetical protein